LILAAHTKYEPFRPLRTPSNRLLIDKMASNGLQINPNPNKYNFEASFEAV
jgi:hypothetical protein